MSDVLNSGKHMPYHSVSLSNMRFELLFSSSTAETVWMRRLSRELIAIVTRFFAFWKKSSRLPPNAPLPPNAGLPPPRLKLGFPPKPDLDLKLGLNAMCSPPVIASTLPVIYPAICL